MQEPDLEAERRLCERARDGDRDALGELLMTHGPRLYRAVLLPRLGNGTAAEEALANTYARVVERFDQFQWQSYGVYPWLRMVALRIALDQLRKKKREVLFDVNDLEREIDAASSEHSAQDLEALDLARGRERVRKLLGRINPRYAQAIRMRVLDDLPREEAAQELGVSVSTFDVVLHRALSALKKALQTEFGDSGDST